MQSLITFSIVLAVAYLAIVATCAIVAALRTGGRREDAGEDRALAVSRFTIPVSIIVPLTRDATSIDRSVAALLDLNYPEFEVIVVGDGSSGSIAEALADWQLEAREFFYRKTIATGEVRRIYRSGRDARLIAIDKPATAKVTAGNSLNYSDALNCGVNVARYRYFMSVDAGVTFDRDALLRVMTAALRDPATVVGASNHVERGADSSAATTSTSNGFVTRAFGLFQRLASARTLMDSRLAWRLLGAGLGPTGSAVVWRRDAVIKLNGFSATAADPDLDMMFRLQTRGIEGGARVDRGTDVFGHAGPAPLGGAMKLVARRQAAALEILAASLKRNATALGGKTLAYFFGSEFVTPLAQSWIVVATLTGAGVGWFSWTTFVLAIVLLSFGNAAVSTTALLLRGSMAGAPEEPELRDLLASAPFEFVCYRPALAVARVTAMLPFLRR